jgi:NTP pyrophosphatase (non-canonical NTP hydrolase)
MTKLEKRGIKGEWDPKLLKIIQSVWWPGDEPSGEQIDPPHPRLQQKVIPGIEKWDLSLIMEKTTEKEIQMQEMKKDLKAYGILLETFQKMDALFTEGKKSVSEAVGFDQPSSIKEWCASAHAVSRSKGWYDDPATGADFCTKVVLIHSEVSEVVEEYRNGKGMNEIYYSAKGKPEGIPIEMADVLIRIFDMCEYFGIDVDAALKIKHEFNKTRPHRHGGKKI